MKNNVIDVLIFLFEHYLDDEIELHHDRERLGGELRDAGFDPNQVNLAFDWLQNLSDQQVEFGGIAGSGQGSVRVYDAGEERRLDVECRGFICFLEQCGVLDAQRRELVIDRVMALEQEDVDLGQLKWIILMVLFNQPGHEASFAWMEELVLDSPADCLH